MARKSGSGTKLLAFGTIAAAGALAGCEQPPPSGDFAFRSVAECQDAGFSQTVCEAKLNEAIQVHAEKAPRFQSLAECEAEYGVGKCGTRTEGAGGQQQSFFSPFLTGFLLSQVINNVSNSAYRTGAGYGGGPIYRNRSGRPVAIPPGTGAGREVVRPRPLNANTRSAARSGFGGRSFSRSRGFGGRGFGG